LGFWGLLFLLFLVVDTLLLLVLFLLLLANVLVNFLFVVALGRDLLVFYEDLDGVLVGLLRVLPFRILYDIFGKASFLEYFGGFGCFFTEFKVSKSIIDEGFRFGEIFFGGIHFFHLLEDKRKDDIFSLLLLMKLFNLGELFDFFELLGLFNFGEGCWILFFGEDGFGDVFWLFKGGI
jgi:hypothetical protein